MRLMHTKLPEFIEKLTKAATGIPGREFAIKGLENVYTTKLQSLRTGRVAEEVQQIAGRPDVARVEVEVLPQLPETTHWVVTKGYGADGRPVKAVLNQITMFHPTVETAVAGFPEVQDNRMSIDVFYPTEKPVLAGYEDIDDTRAPRATQTSGGR